MADGLLVLPAAALSRSELRAIQCPASDPTSFALLRGDRVARFPNPRGWSVEDTARRAVAEHRARLEVEPRSRAPGKRDGEVLGVLITAARAAFLWETIDQGAPQLPVTVTETVRQLADRSMTTRTVAEDALEHYRAFLVERRAPPPATVSELRRVVRDLPAFAR
jgi:hypothetical protein